MARTNAERIDYLTGQVAVLTGVVSGIITAINDKTMPGFAAMTKETLDGIQARLQTSPLSLSQSHLEGVRDAVESLSQQP